MRSLGLRAALAAAVALIVTAAPAGAQEDPYGPTSTTSVPGSVLPTCEVELEAGVPGANASVLVHNVPLGATVRVLIGGEESGQATAPVEAQETTTDLEVPFEMPELSPGDHAVTVVGADFTVACDGPDVEVLSAGQSRTGSGSLPRTGAYIALLVMLAVALIVAGRVIVGRRRTDAL